MRNLSDSDDSRKQGLARFIYKSPWYLGLLCLYFLALVTVIQIEKQGKEAPKCPPSPQATVTMPLTVTPAPKPPGPMRDVRIQCLAAIMAKSKARTLLVAQELADSPGVCLVAEDMYPKGVVPETKNLPAWAVREATRAIDHAD